MSPDELVTLAIEAAEEGLGAGELPIGAVVVLGDEVIGRAYARERTSGGAWCTRTSWLWSRPIACWAWASLDGGRLGRARCGSGSTSSRA